MPESMPDHLTVAELRAFTQGERDGYFGELIRQSSNLGVHLPLDHSPIPSTHERRLERSLAHAAALVDHLIHQSQTFAETLVLVHERLDCLEAKSVSFEDGMEALPAGLPAKWLPAPLDRTG